jgi:CsoR family transcriptional regulator, copper-sensing transcriptional repressor
MSEEMDKSIQYLKTARGQIDGILKMIDEGRYCVDVSNQIIASQSLLKKANMMVLKQHLNHCVKHAFMHNSGEDKIDEIISLLEKLIEK